MNENLILIADDEPDICGEIGGYLSQKGYQFVIAHNGKDAITLFRRDNPIVVLTDYKMPVMNGLELLKNLKSINNKIPVILMSGAADVKVVVSAMKDAAFDFLSKPIDLDELLKVIKAAAARAEKNMSQQAKQDLSGVIIHEVLQGTNDVSVIYLNDDLDEYSVDKYSRRMNTFVNDNVLKENVIIFLEKVKHVDSTGLNFLINIKEMLEARSHKLILSNLSERVSFYLGSLGYHTYFNIEKNLDYFLRKNQIYDA